VLTIPFRHASSIAAPIASACQFKKVTLTACRAGCTSDLSSEFLFCTQEMTQSSK
jgi:hypothetical protein